MKNEAILTPMNAVVKSVSWLWILTGVIFGLIGVWTGSMYFMISGYKNVFTAMRAENEVLDTVLSAISALPYVASLIIILAVLCAVCGFNFSKYRKWSLALSEILSYIIIVSFAGLLVLWIRVWLFSFQIAADKGWEIVGLITGSIVCLFFIVIYIYVLKNIKNKTFRELYNERIQKA